MRTPPQLAIPLSAVAVTAEVKRLLRAADVGNIVPTPKSQILACASLVQMGEMDLAEYEESLSDLAFGFFHKTMRKVLGFLDRRTEQFYVDPLLHDSRKTFVTYHEVIHQIMPWQHISRTEDDEVTLSLECDTLFESEANYGAAEILFQCDRFETEVRDFDVSIASALYLAQKYEASRHSALRRFVERNHRPCLLMILKPTRRENASGGTSFFVSYSIPSTPFILRFGDPLQLQFVNPDHELGRILNNGRMGEIVLADLNGFKRACSVECYCNNYHTFALIYPTDLAHSRRTVAFRF